MRSYILTAVGVAIVVAGAFFFLSRARYELTAPTGEGKYVYKIDKVTGRVWFILNDVMIEVRDRETSLKGRTAEDVAISLAKIYVAPGDTSTLDDNIQHYLQAKRGPLVLHGWNAKKIDDQTYLVGYIYDEGPGSSSGGWVYEVNVKAGLVRAVIGDAGLEKKYVDWVQSLQSKTK